MGRNGFRSRYRIKPNENVHLDDISADDTSGWTRDDARVALEVHVQRLGDLQERLWAERRQGLLVVLQGMDAAGKDGVIRHVMTGFDPLSCRVAIFGRPSAEHLAHDFLWRVHQQVPGRGEVVIFNRSHYEDVLVVRVHDLVPEDTWRRRYDHINAFERLLSDEGTRILKIFLHISKKEQKERLQARLDEPEKRWKFDPNDLVERRSWADYQRAYEDVLEKCSTSWAPWYVVPSDKKWYRDLVISELLLEMLEDMDPQPPEPDLQDVQVE